MRNIWKFFVGIGAVISVFFAGKTVVRGDGVLHRVFHVDQRHALASDGNDGSPARPWKTKYIQPTEIAWQGTVNGTPVRLFATAWHNENEWLPVREIEWVLMDATAKVFILGITGRNLD